MSEYPHRLLMPAGQLKRLTMLAEQLGARSPRQVAESARVAVIHGCDPTEVIETIRRNRPEYFYEHN